MILQKYAKTFEHNPELFANARFCSWFCLPLGGPHNVFVTDCYHWVASMAIPVGKWVIFLYFSLYFSVSVKGLPVTPPLSGVFVHRVFCAYFVRFEGVGVMR